MGRLGPNSSCSRITIHRFVPGGSIDERSDLVAVEEPLEIRIRGRSIAVIMRTPGQDEDLASGFLFTEKIIRLPADLKGVLSGQGSRDPRNTLSVYLASDVTVDFERLARYVYASTSCGLCGKATLEAVRQNFPPIESRICVSSDTIFRLPNLMQRAQRAFAQTGGLHAAALFDLRGGLVVLREDIGRHNAVDKVIGSGFRKNSLPFSDNILLVSGRASLEIMQKALAARIPIVCAVSAPSSLAVEFAQASGQTLVGFLREDRMNVYSNCGRIPRSKRLHHTMV
jgi:FdhD protein